MTFMNNGAGGNAGPGGGSCGGFQVESHPIPQEPKTNKDILQALARGYCAEGNTHKVVDHQLVEVMATEIESWLRTLLAIKDAERDEAVKAARREAVEAYQVRWPYTFLGNTANIGVTQEITEVRVFRRDSITHKIYDEYKFSLPPLVTPKGPLPGEITK